MKLENLKIIRKQKGLSKRELSEISGVAQDTINNLELGRTNAYEVKISTMVKLAKALKVKVRHLVPVDIKKYF